MPSLEDLPKVPTLAAVALTDLVVVYDISVQPNGVKTMTVLDLLTQAIAALPTTNAGASGTLYTNSGVLTLKP